LLILFLLSLMPVWELLRRFSMGKLALPLLVHRLYFLVLLMVNGPARSLVLVETLKKVSFRQVAQLLLVAVAVALTKFLVKKSKKRGPAMAGSLRCGFGRII